MQLVLPAASVFGKEEDGRWPFRAYGQMLAANNISMGRVVTNMQFDTRSAAPRLQFKPVAAVPADIIETLERQRDTPAAEMAIKLTVYQADSSEESTEEVEVATPVLQATESDGEPVVREPKKTQNPAAPTGDVADIVKKWAKK